jgi:hypothetical protein
MDKRGKGETEKKGSKEQNSFYPFSYLPISPFTHFPFSFLSGL